MTIAVETLRALGVAAPNLFLIGGMRCGSTTLHQILGQHPEVGLADVKEPMFWLAEYQRQSEQTVTHTHRRYLEPEKYAELLAPLAGAKWRGEASHYLYAPKIAPVLARDCPDARLVVSLRNPTDRLYSEYLHGRRKAKFSGSFEDFAFNQVTRGKKGNILDVGSQTRIGKGLQARFVAPWLDVFGADRIKFVLFDDIKTDAAKTASDVFRWLDVEPGFTPQIVHTQKSGVPRYPGLFRFMDRGGGPLRKALRLIPKQRRRQIRQRVFSVSLDRPTINRASQQALDTFYREDIQQLQELTGRDLSSWLRRDRG